MKRLMIALLALVGAAAAQAGSSRWGSLKTFGFGSVNRANLGVHLEIPIYTRPTLGRAQINLRLVYDRGIWRLSQPFGQVTQNEEIDYQYCGWWNYNTNQYDAWNDLYIESLDFTEPDGTVLTGVAYMESYGGGGGEPQDGDEYDCPGLTNGGWPEPLPDGKGYTVIQNLDGSGAAFDSAGDEIDGELEDLNGNLVTVTSSGGTVSFNDPLGTALTQTGSGTPSSPVYFTWAGPNGNGQAEEQFETLTVYYGFGCSTSSYQAALPSELDLPDGRKYSFTYNSGGRLTSVTLPTGATLSYGYTENCSGPTFRGDTNLTLSDSVNGGNGWSWALTPQTGGAVQTVETDPYGNASVFSFAAPAWPYETGALTEADFYQGSNTSGTKLESATVATTISNQYVTQQTTEDELFLGSSTLYRQVQTDYSSYGDSTEEQDFDWGNCASCGALLRTVETSFTVLKSAELPTEVKVFDANSQDADTVYARDTHGNVASVKNYVNSSAALTSNFTYAANGNLLTSTGPNGGTVTYTYGNAGSGGCADPNGYGIFPTQIQTETAANTYLTTSATWNCTGGVTLVSKDANGNPTTFTYGDSAETWRPTALQDAAGSTAYLVYPTSSAPATTARYVNFNGGASTVDIVAIADALGRPMLSQKRQAPGSSYFDTVETCYDQMDRPVFTSLPYSATQGQTESCVSSAGATTAYYNDALGRVQQVSDSGGGSTAYAYTGNDVLTTVGPAPSGENTKRRQSEYDGLGRLTSVCEITGGSGYGTCSQLSAQNGYWTRYGYNGLGQIVAVTQNAQAAGSAQQARSFLFDWLGRMISETNPESGTTAYTFDTSSTCSINSNGDLVERLDAAGNVTCYAHDAAHRVTQISYPSGPNATPTKTFVFDSASGLAVSSAPGFPNSNLAGRLVEAFTGPGNSPTTVTGFAYDNMGRTAYTAQESPSSSGWYTTAANYWPNGVMEQLDPGNTGPPGTPTFTYALDGEGRPTQVTASWGPNPVTAASYSALGLTALTLGSGDSDAYTYDPNTGRMTQYQLTVGGQTDTGTVGWNSNGTRSTLGISDPIPGATDNGIGCSYTHDDLGRLLQASCGSFYNETFSYDPFGNHNSGNTPSGLATNFSFSGNRISPGNYDANGNLLADPLLPSQTNAFDAEGHAVTLEGVGVVYDALGRAVEASGHEFLYGPGGAKLAVMNGQSLARADIPLPGGGEAVYGPGGLAYYRHADGLGSAVLSSTPSRTLASSTHHTPFGFDETGAGSGYRSFTGRKQDIDSTHTGGQYDFLTREYNPIQGRWWTPDPAGLAAVDPNNPQTWNRYAYVGGSPLTLVDRLGLDPCNVARLDTESGGAQVGGPHESDSDVAAAEQGAGDCGITSPQQCMLNWAMMDCGLMSELDGGGGGGGGGGGTESADVCPNGFCGGLVWTGNGQGANVDYLALAGTGGAADGYYNSADLANGFHDYNGQIYNDSEWAKEGIYLAYEAGQYDAANRDASQNNMTLQGPTAANGVRGGNENYVVNQKLPCAQCGPGVNTRLGDGLHLECNGDGSSCWVHVDTASPFVGTLTLGSVLTALTTRIGETIEHGAVDVVWGNIGTYVIRR